MHEDGQNSGSVCVYKGCPEGIQPGNMKKRGIYEYGWGFSGHHLHKYKTFLLLVINI